MDELGKNYWSLANGITAFAVAQSLAFAYALADPNSGSKISSKEGIVACAIVLAAIVFCVAVWFCNKAHIALLEKLANNDAALPDAVEKKLAWTMAGRMVAIIGYAGFALLILCTTNAKGA